MSLKARRRPTWKKKSDSWKLELIDEETGKHMDTVRVRNGRKQVNLLMRKHGYAYVENMLRDELIRLAGFYSND